MHARMHARARAHTHHTQYRRAVRESRPQVGSAGDRTARLVCGACGDGRSLSSGAGARKLPSSPPLAHSMMTPLPLYPKHCSARAQWGDLQFAGWWTVDALSVPEWQYEQNLGTTLSHTLVFIDTAPAARTPAKRRHTVETKLHLAGTYR